VEREPVSDLGLLMLDTARRKAINWCNQLPLATLLPREKSAHRPEGKRIAQSSLHLDGTLHDLAA
jgi:hypothetical protein